MKTIIPIECIVKIEYYLTTLYANYINRYFNVLGLKIPIHTGFYTINGNNYVSLSHLYSDLVLDKTKNIINKKPYCEIFYKYQNNYTKSIIKYFDNDNELDIYIDSLKKSINKNIITITS